MATKSSKNGNISEYKDRFSSPIGVKNFVPPKKKTSSKSSSVKRKG